jgi:hypothetical protein
MEGLALGVLVIIILANVLAVVLLLRIGSGHDAHHEVREEREAKSLARLKELYDFPERAVRTNQPQQVEAAPDTIHIEENAEKLAEAVAQLPAEDKIPPSEK